MIYFASPYSHPDPTVREQRFRAACRATSVLLRMGKTVYSPIVHGHPLVEHGVPTEWPFWEHNDRELLQRCKEVVVLMLDGWQESNGVAAEIRIALELGKPIRSLPSDTSAVSPTIAHVATEAEP